MSDVPRSDFSKAPVWFQWALHEIGILETPGGRSTPRIVEYRNIAHSFGGSSEDDGDLPWCAIFVNAALEVSGVPGSRSAGSQSFRQMPDKFVQLEKPALGAITVFWRQSRNSGLGHVGFYRGETGENVYTLGGNQHDAVSIAPFPKNSGSFGLRGYYWPANVPLAIEARGIVPIRAGQPLGNIKVV